MTIFNGPLNQIFQKHSKAAPIYIPTLTRGNNSVSSVLRAAGLNYGPSFQGMNEISAHATETVATAAICDDESEHMSKYAVRWVRCDI